MLEGNDELTAAENVLEGYNENRELDETAAEFEHAETVT